MQYYVAATLHKMITLAQKLEIKACLGLNMSKIATFDQYVALSRK